MISSTILLLLASFNVASSLGAGVTEELNRQLRTAVSRRDIEQVQSLISKGADVNARGSMGKRTPLQEAAGAFSVKSKKIVELLIDNGADVSAKTVFGETLLELPRGRFRREVAEVLIARGADVNARNEETGQTPLHAVARGGMSDLAELYISKGADVNAKANGGATPLGVAAAYGQKEVGDLLVAKGATVSSLNVAAFTGDLDKIKSFIGDGVNAKGLSRLAPIHFVTSREGAEFLIANGADVNAKTSSGETALHRVARGGHKDVVEVLIANGADVSATTPDGQTALHAAARRGHADVAGLLIDKGANVNAQDNNEITPNAGGWTIGTRRGSEDGVTPLHYAVFLRHADVVELLIAKGADVNAAPGAGMSPLQMAKKQKNTEVVRLLEEHGAGERPVARTESPQVRAAANPIPASRPYPVDDQEGMLPPRSRPTRGRSSDSLNQASVEGDVARVKALLDEGTDVNAKNSRMGYTALHGAARNGHKEVVELLLANGADINARENQSKTPLFLAVEYGKKEIVELLLARGADVNAAARGAENALSTAKKKGNTEIEALLTKNGAKDPEIPAGYGDEYYGNEGMQPGGPGAAPRAGPTRGVPQAAVEVDLLADPNEITARLKTFPGLEKAIVDLAVKSKTEMRYWGQTRSDNRTMLARAVQKQLDDEFSLVRKAAIEEKATKTTEAIDTMLKKKKARDSKVRAALMQQRREAMAGQSSRGGGRSRGSGRSSGRSGGRGYSSGRASTYSPTSPSGGYGTRGTTGDGASGLYGDNGNMGTAARGRSGRTSARPPEQLDADTQEEMRLWEQATPDKKVDLAKSLHPLTYGDFASIRKIAVDEEAKKTTAAIDGILLARQVRFDVYVKMAEALRSVLAPGQPGMVDQYGNPILPGVRSGRGRTRGGAGTQQQQNTQTGGRRRR
jgi:cytohesin